MERFITRFKCFPDRGHNTAGNPHTHISMMLLSKVFIFNKWECSCQCKHSAVILRFSHPISWHRMKISQNSFPLIILKSNKLINIYLFLPINPINFLHFNFPGFGLYVFITPLYTRTFDSDRNWYKCQWIMVLMILILRACLHMVQYGRSYSKKRIRYAVTKPKPSF